MGLVKSVRTLPQFGLLLDMKVTLESRSNWLLLSPSCSETPASGRCRSLRDLSDCWDAVHELGTLSQLGIAQELMLTLESRRRLLLLSPSYSGTTRSDANV
jgi:hypothetical protein